MTIRTSRDRRMGQSLMPAALISDTRSGNGWESSLKGMASALGAVLPWAVGGAASLLGTLKSVPVSVAASARGGVMGLLLLSASAGVLAQAPASPDDASAGGAVYYWLNRINAAARSTSFEGTYVLTTPSQISSSHIVHISQDNNQYERIDMLDGQQRQIFRYNDVVHTMYPARKIVIVEHRLSGDAFPALLKTEDARLGEAYGVRNRGQGRVANRRAQVIEVTPRDDLRFGYRLWADEATGLLLRSQVLNPKGQVLEQSAFSDLKIGTAIGADSVIKAMKSLSGYKIRELKLTHTTAEKEGWTLRNGVPGFEPVDCVLRPLSSSGGHLMQWIFSDGMASVSMFIEPVNPSLHLREGYRGSGATSSLTARNGQWWITLVGEVPQVTLERFVHELQRREP